MNPIDEQLNAIERRKNEKEEKEKEKGKIYQEDERPDEIADNIKEKINHTDLEDWQILQIIEMIKNDKLDVAVGKLSELIILEEKEKQHFKKLPIEIVLSWFKKFIPE